MKKTIYTKLLFACSVLCLLTSCSKEDLSTEQLQPQLNHAEVYLNSHNVPPIIFSYEVFNPTTNVLNSFLIDEEGQIRTNTKQATGLRQNLVQSSNQLQTVKDEAKVMDQSVSLEEVVQNFNLMRTVDGLTYDTEVKAEDSQTMTAIYAYYYEQTATTSYESNSQGCGGEEGTTTTTTTTGGHTTGSFRAILLEQRLAKDVLQKIESSKFTINWITDLVNASTMDFSDN